MQISDLVIEGLKLIQLKSFDDERGFFMERFNESKFSELGLPSRFVQDNHSSSHPGVLRGLHYQYNPPQGKLVSVIKGSILDVAVDIRPSSRTFGQFVAVELSAKNKKMLWMPAGFAHGFCVLGNEPAEVIYKVDHLWNGKGESGIRWNDPDLAIPWPVKNPIIATKDQQQPLFAEYKKSDICARHWW